MPSNYKTVINFRDGIQVDTDDLISNNGLVGIGSTIPRQQLDVRGNVIVDGVSEFNNVKVTGISTFYNNVNVASGSSVGIGTTVPEEAFQVGVGTTGFTVSLQGIVTATKFVGDGSELTGIPASVWVNPGAGDTIYSEKIVGIGTTLTRGNAGFGVGYEIYMDPVAGVGTFEGVVTKNLTVTNTTGAGQGNVNADVGTFSTVTATTQITAPTFIGTVTNATRAVVAAGLTDSPDVAVNYITGVGGTFTGITSFTTLQISGGVIGEAGIITATTFSGTATTASNAAVAYGIAGDPDIQVDKLTVNGLAPTILKGSGVSTVGQDLLVGEFLGVGATASAAGEAAGFIGTVRIHDGDLKLGGSISIGGSLVGSFNLGGSQDINVLNVGAGLSVAGITSLTGDVTGGANFNITGQITGNEVDALDSITAGGGITCGSGLVVGSVVSGSPITVQNGGGLIIGSGITMNGPIDGATSIAANGPITGVTSITANGDITGVQHLNASGNIIASGTLQGANINATNANFVGVSTLGTAAVTNLSVAGDLSVTGVGTIATGNLEINGATGIVSASSFYSPVGISTFADIRVSGGTGTLLFAKYIGINTSSPQITEGTELYHTDTELFLHGQTKGVGIGSTSGDRQPEAKLYVGYGRSAVGNTLVDTTSIFECGNIGIGTTAVNNTGSRERVSIYRDINFYPNHTGAGATISSGAGTTTHVRVGFNSENPGGALDLRNSGGALCLPIITTVPTGGEASVPHSEGPHRGNLWFDGVNDVLRIALNQGGSTGIMTEGKYQPDDYRRIRGWYGPIIPNETVRDTDSEIVPNEPPAEPVGWNTSNVVYNTTVNQFQYRTSDSKWKTQVSTAQTGTEIIINGTTAILNVAGIGSISLGTLS